MNKKIVQLNVREINNEIKLGIIYNIYKDDGSLFSNNNAISFKLKSNKILNRKIEELIECIENDI